MMSRTCVAAAGLYCGLGLSVPIAATTAGIIAVILVRVILWSKNQSIMWNVAVCGLAMMATFATIEGSEMTTFYGFWVGTGYGALGVGIVEIGKNMMKGALGDRFKDAASVLFGIKKEPNDPPSDEQ